MKAKQLIEIAFAGGDKVPQVRCPNCGWKGRIAEVRPASFSPGECPKCGWEVVKLVQPNDDDSL